MVVREWDAVDGRLKGVRRLSNYSAWACALSPDGKYFLTNGNWGPDADKLVVWNVGTGERAFSRQFPAPAGVKAAAYLPDGSGVIVLVETQKHSAVGRADFATGNWQELFAVPIANGEHLELSPDGRKVAVRAGQGFLFCWDLDTNNALWRLTGMGTAFTFSPDSKTIVVDNSPAKTLEFHDAATGEKIADAKLPAQHRSWGEWSGTVNFSLRFTPDSRGLLFYDHDKRAMIVWDLVSGKERLRLAAGFIVNRRSAFAPDGSLVTLARTLQRWDLKTGKPAFSDNERAGHTKAPSRFEFSADGRRLLSVSTDHTARVWDVATTTPLATFRGHDSDQVSAGRFLHGGREVITAGNDGYLRVWDAVTSQEERSMPYREKEDVESAYAQHLCLAADGRTVTSFNSTGRGVRLMRYDATTGEKLTSTLVSGWTPSPDGRLAFPRANTSARLIDTETNGTFGVIEYGTPAGVCDSLDEHVTSFSADARLFAGLLRRSPGGNSAEWIVQVWETTGGPPIESIATTAFFYVPHAFSRDGRLFAFGEPDALRVWDLAAGRETWRREDATRNVTALAFTPDGRALAAASDDTTILLWALPAPAKGKPIAAAERDAVWQSLGSSDVATAHAAQWRLTDDRDTAVALIRAKLLPAPAAAEAVRSHIQNLSSADFKTREAAERRLKDLGRAAAKELRAAHAAESQPEAKRRVEALLAALDAETARDVRAVAILERIATPAARKLLDDISHTSPPRAAANAKLALQRLAD